MSRVPIQLAITEWGNVGENPSRFHIENFGAEAYGGSFLNLLIRNADRIPIANTTGFMHGGCLRKAFGITYYDPQYLVIQQYADFIDQIPVAVRLTGPGFDVEHPADQGGVEQDIPFIDVVACRLGDGERRESSELLLAVVNRHLKATLPLRISVPGLSLPSEINVATLAYPEITARTTPAQPNRFSIKRVRMPVENESIEVVLPPFSLTWVRV